MNNVLIIKFDNKLINKCSLKLKLRTQNLFCTMQYHIISIKCIKTLFNYYDYTAHNSF